MINIVMELDEYVMTVAVYTGIIRKIFITHKYVEKFVYRKWHI